MNINTILFPTDFSAASKHAFDFACSLAREQSARIVVLHVLEPIPETGQALLAYSFEDEHVERLRNQLHEIKPPDGTIPIEHRLLRGDVVSQILQVAEEIAADLIVMGTHGRTGVFHLLLGSIAEGVVRRANCAVVTVKKPHAAESASQANRPTKSEDPPSSPAVG